MKKPKNFCFLKLRYSRANFRFIQLHMWKILSSKPLFRHPRLSLIEDEVELPNGSKTSYLKYDDDGSCGATVIAKRDDGKILLQREYSHPTGKKLYQFPGGHVPAGETPEVGANREFMEEAGLKSNNLQLLGKYYLNHRRSTAMMHVYLATDLQEAFKKGDPEEEIESFWYDEKEIDEMIRKGEIINSTVLAAWSLYKNHSSKE